MSPAAAARKPDKVPNPLSAALRRCKVGLVFVFIFSFAVNLLMLTAPLYMLQIFDRVLTSRSENTLIYLTLIAGFAFVVFWSLDLLRGRVMVALGTWLTRDVGGNVLAAAVKAGLRRGSATIRPLQDLKAIGDFLTGPAIFSILDAPWTPIFIAVVFLLHPLLGWFGTASVVVLFLFAVANDLLTRRALQTAGHSTAQAMDRAQAMVRNADVVEAMGMLPDMVSRWYGESDRALVDHAQASRRNGFITSSSKSIRQLLQVGILGIGAWLVLKNQLTAGGMIAASILMGRALAPVEQAIASWRSSVLAHSAYRRVKDLLTELANVKPLPALPPAKGRLTVENAYLVYPGRTDPDLRGISFTLEPGESLGMIGPTASGKTTLARLLVGNLVPEHGHASLDGANLADWSPHDRARAIGYVPQSVELFCGTVRDNMTRFRSCRMESVYVAAQLAGVHEEVMGLPAGYDTEIGVSGLPLSGGQRQKIALARAILGNPRLVVLDEPNSNLDLKGEAALVETLKYLRERGATVVIIAHRPSVLRTVDKILVLQAGTVQMMGDRDEVFAEFVPELRRSRSGAPTMTEAAEAW